MRARITVKQLIKKLSKYPEDAKILIPNKECISINVCKHDKTVNLEKIKAEIRHNSEHFINDDGEDCLALYEDDVIEIINKYKE